MFVTQPHPPMNELAIVMALSRQPLVQTREKASLPGMGAQQGERTVFSTCWCIEERNSPPGTNQGVFKAEPRDSHTVATLRVHPPNSPCPALSAHVEPISKAESFMPSTDGHIQGVNVPFSLQVLVQTPEWTKCCE